MKSNESALVKSCLQYLAMRGCFAWRVNSGAMRGEYKGKARYVKFNSVPGVSDILGIREGGQFIAVECKVGTNKLTQDQRMFLLHVMSRGGLGIVAYSIDDVAQALRD